MRYIRRKGADVLNQANIGVDALYAACQNGFIEVVQYLTEHGANVNMACIVGWSLLHAACESGHALVVAYLLARGANINACALEGVSSIEFAHGGGHGDIVKLLHAGGAIVADRVVGETGLQTKSMKAVLAIGDETDVREACDNGGCRKVEVAYGEYSACASCKLVFYCSKECQVSAWRSHKKACKRDAAAKVASEATASSPAA